MPRGGPRLNGQEVANVRETSALLKPGKSYARWRRRLREQFYRCVRTTEYGQAALEMQSVKNHIVNGKVKCNSAEQSN